MAILEFCLPPAALPDLLARPVFGRRSGRQVATEQIWHDTASGDLAADHLTLLQAGQAWRLERASPRPDELWPPATPAPLITEANDIAALGPLPGPLMPIAGFRGTRRVIRLTSDLPATLSVLDGTLRGVAQEQPVCRLVLEGPPELLASLSMDWAASVPLEPPRWSLGTQAIALARGMTPPSRRSGAPEVATGMSVADAIALVIGHLTDVILAEVPAVFEHASDEPVHAMRVAIRRLRSALSVFRRVADGPALAGLKSEVGELAKTLGVARDWDVFLAGTGAAVAAALPNDPRIQPMLAAAARRRDRAYASLQQTLASARFRQLMVGLVQFAALRPWYAEASEEQRAELDANAEKLARDALARQYRHLKAAGPDLSAMATDDLHTLRKHGKKLRYTTEFFAAFYVERRTRRFLRRLSQVQEALGHLNDGAAAATLMTALHGGAERQFAAGVVQGYIAGRHTDTHDAIDKSWRRLWFTKPFWL